ncbi:MAG TPA: LON peptidase substrate-binding domain-containing protein [Thermomicrobiales bacterium]|jgi:hypothetical protein|nr:LON peptidase substrate-binding domain-containing protein [Thermomicrobiales bacterium]
MDDLSHNDREAALPAAALPLFPLSSPLFPGMPMPLHIFEERYRQLLRDREGSDPIFGVVLTRSGREVGDQPEIHSTGTGAELVVIRPYEDGRADILLRGTRRFRVTAHDWSGPYLLGQVEWLPDPSVEIDSVDGLAGEAAAGMGRLIGLAAAASGMATPNLELPADPTALSYTLSWTLWVNSWERQELLEVPDTRARLARLVEIIRREERLLRTTGASGVPIDHPGQRFLPN